MKRSLWSSTLIGALVGALLLPFAFGILWLAPEDSVIQGILYLPFSPSCYRPYFSQLMIAAIELFWIVFGAVPGVAVWILTRLGTAQRKT